MVAAEPGCGSLPVAMKRWYAFQPASVEMSMSIAWSLPSLSSFVLPTDRLASPSLTPSFSACLTKSSSPTITRIVRASMRLMPLETRRPSS